MQKFQLTLPLRGATLFLILLSVDHRVSTHAPLAGSDLSGGLVVSVVIGVSTHAPLAGSDCMAVAMRVREQWFQLTLPLRGATGIAPSRRWLKRCFNSRSPCGERHVGMPHTVAVEVFQLTLPLRGATAAI